MSVRTRKKIPKIVIRDGKPIAVILDINEYEELLEKIDDTEDLQMLRDMRKKALKFRKFEDFLEDRN
jgi:hypothetical protein